MAKPHAPTELDGVALPRVALADFRRLIETIWTPDPTRAPASILVQAERGFRKVYKLAAGAWVKRAIVQLGAPDQAGALLRFPSGSPDVMP